MNPFLLYTCSLCLELVSLILALAMVMVWVPRLPIHHPTFAVKAGAHPIEQKGALSRYIILPTHTLIFYLLIQLACFLRIIYLQRSSPCDEITKMHRTKRPPLPFSFFSSNSQDSPPTSTNKPLKVSKNLKPSQFTCTHSQLL